MRECVLHYTPVDSALLEWTISDVGDERTNVESFYKVALSLCSEDAQQHLAELKHCIEEAKIGKTRDKQKILKKKNSNLVAVVLS